MNIFEKFDVLKKINKIDKKFLFYFFSKLFFYLFYLFT